MEQAKNFITNNWKYILGLAVVLALLLWGYQYFQQPQSVITMSQQQAETPAGVELAAKNAQVEMLQGQLDDAAQQIAELKNKPPDTVVKVVPVEVTKTIDVERKKSGADFAIITDPEQPDKPVNLADIEKLPADTTINLNQYNVHAYKKVIRQIEIAPDWKRLARGDFKVDTVGYGIAKKISKSGKYLGLKGQYDFDDKEGKVLMQYMY